ncbi:aminotransferase class V-fold PLP-dependent enzyme [Kutzneria kofuensis]
MSRAAAAEVPFPMLGGVLDEPELAVLGEVLRSGDRLSQGQWRDRFERAFADHVGARHALTVTSGTVALEMAVRLLDLQPGDEVIATPQTFQATVHALLGLPVTVRFCDIDANSLNIDVARMAELVTPRTRAVMLVHYGGLPAPMDEIMAITRPRGIVVVEDCAHALGASYRGRRPGALADIGCFSFHSSKTITTLGEGGMITFDRDDWAERVARIRGNDCDGVYRAATARFDEVPKALYPGLAHTHECVTVRDPGTNATMGEPAAAVGLVQLGRLAELSARRRHVAGVLDDHLRDRDDIRIQAVPPDVVHGRHLYTCFVEPGSGIDRNALIRSLEDLGVEMWLRYFPLHLLPEWRSRGHDFGECPTAERLWFGSQLNLPCHPALTDIHLERLVAALDKALAGARA